MLLIGVVFVSELLGFLVERAIGLLNWFELGFNPVQAEFGAKGANSKIEQASSQQLMP
ncbi:MULTISPECIES: hypothetical protein [Trichocoleus]|uniref:Uncharacterized protein n=1 Tax=Trichocoleus desertorum GB2-A4 TaxID=2933944 RepID=A0ABV0JCR1_9CYAN|nr:hypothetical protein [Trichocoleus sp. FACHB-46]MBD1864228.1 hypothetical protein [Trichocoleus sp. FACHB-46]